MRASDGAASGDGAAAAMGVVVIGRNEGERLERCLRSVLACASEVVYVDSGSTDGSADAAREMGARVVDLDMSMPFTAARARNAGLRRLMADAPQTQYVFFIDGDCEAASTWPDAGMRFLEQHADVAAVCGRLRERHPERSVYNRLCDLEWDGAKGEVRSCGGIVIMRAAPVQELGGFREDLIAGEEPELCVRLRRAGWKVWRLDAEMALHDAAMTHFSQWWKRAKRGGHAFAEGAWLHGAAPERHGRHETTRALLWGVVLPVGIVLLSLANWKVLVLFMIYPLQVGRLALRFGSAGHAAWSRALFLVLARFAEAQGALTFWLNRLRRRRSTLIEYK